jgi:hypothetical protein
MIKLPLASPIAPCYPLRNATKEEFMQLVDEKEAARIMGRGLQTLRNDRSMRRGIPYVKIGKSVRYSVDDIRKYIEKHRVDTEVPV